MDAPSGFSTTAPDVESVRESLQRVIAWPGFGPPRRADLLCYLVERTLTGRHGELVEYAIALDVFGRPHSFDPRLDSTVRSEMSRLRRVLAQYYGGDGAAEPWRFEFPNRGYVPAIVSQEKGQAATMEKARPRRSLTAWGVGAVLVVALCGAGLWLASPSLKPRSVVVLPFANLTGDPANDYISDGLTEGLTDALAHLSGLRVVARTSAFQFRGKNTDIRQIARKVHVDTVVEGSLRKVGDGLRVTVQVNRAADGFHMLSRAFDGTAAELARMERDMTVPVVAAIRPSAVPAGGHLPDPQAYELLLKARGLRGQSTPDGFHKIVEYLHQAVQRDPQYANAYAALARAYVAAAANTLIEPSAAIPLAHIAVSTALALDPQSAAAYDAMGFGDAMLELHWKKGEEELRKAVRLLPQDATIRQHLGLVLLCEGHFADAIAELKTAEDLDPLSPAAGSSVGLAFFLARRYDDALAQYRRVAVQHPEGGPINVLTGQVYVAKGEFAKGVAEYRKGLDAFHQDKSTLLVHALAVSGKRDEALAQLAAVEDPDYPDPIDLAAIYGALGDRDRAFSWLEKGLSKRKVYLIKVHPFLDPLRSDPRFAGLLQRAGF